MRLYADGIAVGVRSVDGDGDERPSCGPHLEYADGFFIRRRHMSYADETIRRRRPSAYGYADGKRAYADGFRPSAYCGVPVIHAGLISR